MLSSLNPQVAGCLELESPNPPDRSSGNSASSLDLSTNITPPFTRLISDRNSMAIIHSFPNLAVFFFMFAVIYNIAYFIVFRNWSPKIRPEASSCLISFFHGTPAAVLAAHAILADPARGFSAPNTTFQNLVLDYSIAYFLMDLLHYLIFFPSDVLFIAHHLATLFVFVTCRHVAAHGAFSVLSLLVLAEVTSFCQNVWTLARARRLDDKFAAEVHDFLSPYFYGFYTVVRGVVAPYFLYRMAIFYLGGSAGELIPMWVCISWTVVVFVALGVSISWIWNLWVELHTERKNKLVEKSR